jgi:hypothetical protein
MNRLIMLMVMVLALSGCMGKATEPFKDAPEGNRNTGPADTLTMPDGFSNVASKCDGPNRVYVLFKGDKPYGSIAVVPNDPRCK